MRRNFLKVLRGLIPQRGERLPLLAYFPPFLIIFIVFLFMPIFLDYYCLSEADCLKTNISLEENDFIDTLECPQSSKYLLCEKSSSTELINPFRYCNRFQAFNLIAPTLTPINLRC